MSKTDQPSQEKPATVEGLSRPIHGHQQSGPLGADGGRQEFDAVDLHPTWLKKWRSLRAGLGGIGGSQNTAEAARELRDQIAHTPACTLAGLQAQAELISELAWNDIVAATARQLIAGLKRLQ